MKSWCLAASSRISLVKGERNVRYGETAPDDSWVRTSFDMKKYQNPDGIPFF